MKSEQAEMGKRGKSESAGDGKPACGIDAAPPRVDRMDDVLRRGRP